MAKPTLDEIFKSGTTVKSTAPIAPQKPSLDQIFSSPSATSAPVSSRVPEQVGWGDGIAQGVAKGEIATIKGLSDLGGKIADQTVGRVINAATGKGFKASNSSGEFERLVGGKEKSDSLTVPTTTSQRIGYGAEKLAEFFLPAASQAKAEAAINLLSKGIKSPLLAATARVGAKAAVSGVGAGTIKLAQSGGDLKETAKTAATAGVVRGAMGVVGEASRALRLPTRVYNAIFKNTKNDMRTELNSEALNQWAKQKPDEFNALVKKGLIKVNTDPRYIEATKHFQEGGVIPNTIKTYTNYADDLNAKNVRLAMQIENGKAMAIGDKVKSMAELQSMSKDLVNPNMLGLSPEQIYADPAKKIFNIEVAKQLIGDSVKALKQDGLDDVATQLQKAFMGREATLTADDITKTALEVIKKSSPKIPVINDTLAERALERGLKGSNRQMATEVIKGSIKSEDQLQTVLGNYKGTVNVSEKQYFSVLKKIASEYEDVGFGEIAGQADDLANRISASKGQVDGITALEIRRFLDRMRIMSSFDKPASSLSMTQANFKTLADTMRGRLAKIPGVDPIMKDYSFYIEALEAIAANAARTGNAKVLSVIDSLFLGGATFSANPVPLVGMAVARRLFNASGTLTNLGQAMNNSVLGPAGQGVINAGSGGVGSLLNAAQ